MSALVIPRVRGCGGCDARAEAAARCVEEHGIVPSSVVVVEIVEPLTAGVCDFHDAVRRGAARVAQVVNLAYFAAAQRAHAAR